MKKHHIINSSVYKKLEDIFSYIAIESQKSALEVIDEIEKQIMSLELFPERFALVMCWTGFATTTVRFRSLRVEEVSNFSLRFCAIHFDEVSQILGSLE